MPLTGPTDGLPNKANQSVASGFGRCRRTWVTSSTRAVHFPRRDAREPDTGSFCTPERTIPVPNPGRGTSKSLTSRHDLGEQEGEDHSALIAATIPAPNAPSAKIIIIQYSISRARCFQLGFSRECLVICAIMQNDVL